MSRFSVASTLARAAAAVDAGERRRARLLAVAAAWCGAFILAAVSLATFAADAATCPPDAMTCDGSASAVSSDWGLAPYVAQHGLRPGVITGALLLVVPFALFAVQALRLGSAARDRRLAAMRLHGATMADLRWVAGAQTWRPAALGGLGALPAYLVLYVLLGLLPPFGWRMLPTPGLPVALAWPLVALGVAFAHAATAAAAVPAAAADPLGISRRKARPLGWRAAAAPVVFACLLLASLLQTYFLAGGGELYVFLLPFLAVLTAVGLGPWFVVLAGRICVRSRRPHVMIAGRRLLADPRTPGRVAGALFGVGLAIGIATLGVVGIMQAYDDPRDRTFYISGFALAAAGAAVAAVVASACLVVGAGEQVLDARRPTAALVAMGASPRTIRRVLATGLQASSIVPAAAGAVCGWVVGGALMIPGGEGWRWTVVVAVMLALVAAIVIAAGAAALGAGVATALLRPAVEEAMAVENLRTA